MLNWLQKLVSGSPAKATQTEVSAYLVRQKEDGSLIEVEPANIFARSEENDSNLTSGELIDPAQAQNTALVAGAGAVAVSDSSPALDLDPDQTPALDLDLPPVTVPALTPAPDPVSIIDPIINLVNSIFEEDAKNRLKEYFSSIFIPPEDDDTKKSTASTNLTLTSAQETELRETLEKCANAYISGDTDLTPSDSSDTQSSSTKTTSKSSQILKEKAEPPVYFGVGIKTELAEAGDEKFLKITNIFEESKLHKEKQGNVDYTNQFITHLNCKLGDDTEAREYSITDIFNKFKGDPNQKEKFDEKIDQIFRDISQTSIKFKISADKSQPASSEVNIDKIIFEKTPDGAYKQKTTTPSPITEIRDAKGKGVEVGGVGVAV